MNFIWPSLRSPILSDFERDVALLDDDPFAFTADLREESSSTQISDDGFSPFDEPIFNFPTGESIFAPKEYSLRDDNVSALEDREFCSSLNDGNPIGEICYYKIGLSRKHVVDTAEALSSVPLNITNKRPKRLKRRVCEFSGSRKIASRIYGLWLLFSGYLPEVSPENLSKGAWKALKKKQNEKSLITFSSLCLNETNDGSAISTCVVTVALHRTFASICRLTTIHGNINPLSSKEEEMDALKKADFHWWSDSPVCKPIKSKGDAGLETITRSFTIPWKVVSNLVSKEWMLACEKQALINTLARCFQLTFQVYMGNWYDVVVKRGLGKGRIPIVPAKSFPESQEQAIQRVFELNRWKYPPEELFQLPFHQRGIARDGAVLIVSER